MDFVTQQQKNLRRILQQNAKASQSCHLGLNELTRYKDFDLLYQSFMRASPVQDYAHWVRSLRRMTGDKTTPTSTFLMEPGLISKPDPLGLAWFLGTRAPIGKDVLEDYATLEETLSEYTDEKSTFFFRLFDFIHHDDTHVAPLEIMAQQQRTWFQNLRYKPIQDFGHVLENGRSRYQLIHALYEQALAQGSTVRVLVAPARLLTQFALYAARQKGAFVPLREIFPHLAYYVQTGPMAKLHQTELAYLFSGLPHLKRLYALQEPSGFMAFQPDRNLNNRLQFVEDTHVFYEFIPEDDMDVNGHLYRNFRRYYAGQLTQGKTYTVLVTNAHGLLSYNTGWMIKVLNAESGQFMLVGRQKGVNAFGEALPIWQMSNILNEINDIVGAQGLFIRDYAVGAIHQERRHHWVIELSRPLNLLDAQVFKGLGQRLHAELELRHPLYRQALQKAAMEAPKISFVGMGTFSALPDPVQFEHVDSTVELKLLDFLIRLAGVNMKTVDLTDLF